MIEAHPSQSELLAYAESSGANVSEEIALHVRACSYCSREVETITDTIAITAHAKELAPTREFQATVLLAARQHRGPLRRPDRSMARKAVICLAVLAVVSTAGVASVHLTGFAIEPAQDSSSVAQASLFSIEILRQVSPEEAVLAPVVMNATAFEQSPWVSSQQRAATVWDAEIDAALAAIEQNPAYVGAASVVNSNRARLGETLKVLYAEQSN